jgi:hypothetical protein
MNISIIKVLEKRVYLTACKMSEASYSLQIHVSHDRHVGNAD